MAVVDQSVEEGLGAIVDRLTFNATIIETGSDSYGLAKTRVQQSTSTA